MDWNEQEEMRSQPVLCRACGRDWRDETSQNGKSTLALGCLQGLGLRGHEQILIKKTERQTEYAALPELNRNWHLYA
ncbi:MAG TPA: hypothetical protein VK102_06640 [Sphingobacterium sp.]|nr:hypothetical protein [Sphingobacterium sp.]